MALGTVLSTVACGATAGCGGWPLAGAAPVGMSGPLAQPAGRLSRAASVGAHAGYMKVGAFMSVNDSERDHADLVGMWNVNFISDGSAYPHPIPNGVVYDFATIQYHSDGTEFQISGGRAPSTGDVCMGIWQQTGERTYKVKHLALAWASPDSMPPSTTKYLGPARLTETIHLNRRGDRFDGTVTLDQYADDGVTLLEHISGTMVGIRFSFD